MLCFLVSLQHLSSSVFSLGRDSHAAFSEFQAAEAEKAAEVQKALEAQTAAEAQLAAAGGHAGQCRPMPMASGQILNSALPQALRQQLPVKYRKHL